ncbi:hypothetical protein PR202_ga29042 [Eleusine coracana subsp. coracana]|uniref:Uncharacterized protein n=1 Tax=Eleusine coracana subsp. coracana TaxID=191504 RepID=A0AAV5DLW8_ELECO|nr:hypothetical protein PR202_ga29042 [Eleusine coracana subsp. coracana]
MSDSTATCIDIILAIILPPLGVFFKCGCSVSARPTAHLQLFIELLISIVLTVFGWIPGIIYAVWVITK